MTYRAFFMPAESGCRRRNRADAHFVYIGWMTHET